jgi:hypothetical protein
MGIPFIRDIREIRGSFFSAVTVRLVSVAVTVGATHEIGMMQIRKKPHFPWQFRA